jgi:hypothetical protein
MQTPTPSHTSATNHRRERPSTRPFPVASAFSQLFTLRMHGRGRPPSTMSRQRTSTDLPGLGPDLVPTPISPNCGSLIVGMKGTLMKVLPKVFTRRSLNRQLVGQIPHKPFFFSNQPPNPPPNNGYPRHCIGGHQALLISNVNKRSIQWMLRLYPFVQL